MDLTKEAACAALAARQYGVITRSQALELGLSGSAIDRRVRTTWTLLHPRTYALPGSSPSWERDIFAACAWAQGGAASHRAAGALFDLPGCQRAPIEITVRRCRLAPRCGIRMHHSDRLPDEHLTVIRKIPCTSIERTLMDLAGSWHRVGVASALDDALRRGLTSIREVDACIGKVAKRGRRGCGVLRELVRDRWMLRATPHSPLETRLFELISKSSLPLPELQYEIRDEARFVARVDFCYPAWKVVVEADSWKHHSGRQDWSNDVARGNLLTRLGWRVHRVTWTDVTEYPERTLLDIAELLEHGV